MNQVLFWIPIKTGWTPQGIPVYGFGMMLFLAFVVSTYLAGRRAARQGIPGERMQDLILWIFVGGLIGGRLFFLIQFKVPLAEFFAIWNGGIVFYGSAAGGLVGYLISTRVMSRLNVSAWQIGDILAPSIAIGLALGRIGCFLNGCCYGNVAPPDASFAARFPIMTAPARELVYRYQTLAGFTVEPRDPPTVDAVEPDSPAARLGLRHGDVIVAVDGQSVASNADLTYVLSPQAWPRGKKDVSFTVRRGAAEEVIGPYVPRTLGLNPTQVYETVSMLLLFVVLATLYPMRRFDGQVLAVLMVCYAVHRYFNELLRHDTPTYFLGLTISQEISILLFTGGVVIWLLRRHTPVAPPLEPPPEPEQAEPKRHAQEVKSHV